MRSRIALSLLFLAACSTEHRERNLTGMWTDAQAPQRKAAPAAEEPPPAREVQGTVISIPPEVAAQHTQFLERPATIFGDVVEIEASRLGWLAAAGIAVARDAVDRTDDEDAQTGVLTITLTRRPQVAAQMDSVPTVHFGNGLRVVGVDRIVLKFSAKQSAERPLWFQATASGKKAIYEISGPQPDAPLARREGSRVSVRTEIRRQGEAYHYDESAEATP